MSDRIHVEAIVSMLQLSAFNRFIMLSSWWPKSYTWSGQAECTMLMNPRAGGLLSEIGPHGFRCDLGRVVLIEPPRRLILAWQIGCNREPQPNPRNASEIEIIFTPRTERTTLVGLTHRYFEHHGGDFEAYRRAMASQPGWPHILRAFCGENAVAEFGD